MDKLVKLFASSKKAEKLGQHFLIDLKVLEKIVKEANIKKIDTILEVGPGLGVLTEKLLQKASKVLVVEKDKDMVSFLRQNFKNSKNIFIYHGDILKFNIEKNIKGKYKVVANIPYYLTSRLIRNFLERKNKPQKIVLMVQKEVAERIIARPNKENLLSISVKFYGKPRIIAVVPSASFYPKPKVESAIIEIAEIKNRYRDINEREFFRLIKIGFASPRKKLANNLSVGFKKNKNEVETILKNAKLDINTRAEDLTINNWLLILKEMGRNG